MKKNIIYLLIVNLIMSLSLLNIAFANNPDGAPGVSGKPVSVDIMRLPPPTQNINILYKEVERGNVPAPAALELIKNKT